MLDCLPSLSSRLGNIWTPDSGMISYNASLDQFYANATSARSFHLNDGICEDEKEWKIVGQGLKDWHVLMSPILMTKASHYVWLLQRLLPTESALGAEVFTYEGSRSVE